MKTFKHIENIFDKIFNIFQSVQILSLVLICSLVFIQIVLREVFNIGIAWAFELSCFFQVTMVWLGAPVLLYKEKNIRINIRRQDVEEV